MFRPAPRLFILLVIVALPRAALVVKLVSWARRPRGRWQSGIVVAFLPAIAPIAEPSLRGVSPLLRPVVFPGFVTIGVPPVLLPGPTTTAAFVVVTTADVAFPGKDLGEGTFTLLPGKLSHQEGHQGMARSVSGWGESCQVIAGK